MPIARFQMPDGRIARFEVPDGTSPEQAQMMMEQELANMAQAQKPPTASTTLRDVGVAGASGVVGAAKSMTDFFGADNAASKALGEASTSLQGMYTPERQKEMQYYQQLQDEAAKRGDTMGEIGAAFQGIKAAPLQGVVQAVGSLIPNLASLAFPGAGQARALQLSRGAINTALGIVQGTGAVKGALYEGVKQELMKNGMDEASASKQASEAQSYFGPNTDQILLGAGIGLATGKLGAEELLSPTVQGAARKAVAVGAEAGTEALQGGQEQVAQNLGLTRAGMETPMFQGVAGAATQEGILGGLGAGPVTLLHGRPKQEDVPDAKPVDENQIPLLLEGKGAFVPVGLPDGSVAMTREDLAAFEAEQFRKKYAPQDIEREKLLLEHQPFPFAPVGLPDGSVATTREELARYEEEQFQKKYAPQDIERQKLLLGYEPFTPKVTPAGTVVMSPEDIAKAEELDFRKKYEPKPFAGTELEQRQLMQRAATPIEGEFFPVVPQEITEEERRIAREAKENKAKGIKPPKLEIEQLQEEAKKIEYDIKKNTSGKLAGKSLRQALIGQLAPSEVSDISPDKSFNPLKAAKRGRSIADIIEDGELNDWLPHNMRPDSNTFDPQYSAEYIKDQIRNKNFREAEPQIKARLLQRDLELIQQKIAELKAPQEIQSKLAELSPEDIKAESARIASEQGYTGAPLTEAPLEEAVPPMSSIETNQGEVTNEPTTVKPATVKPDDLFSTSSIEQPAANVPTDVSATPAEGIQTPSTPEDTGRIEKPKYMQAKTGERGMSKADVELAVDRIKRTWENAPEVEVVQSITGLPEDIQKQIKKEGVNPRGVYDPDTKKVWLVADNIPTDAQAAITLAHEAFGHFGLRVALGKNFKPMMSSIFEGNKDVRTRAQEYINDGMDLTTAVEEVLSEMAQEILDTSVPLEKLRANRTALQKIMNAIRQFLSRIGVPIKTIDDATVLDLIRTARHMVTEGKSVSREMVGGKALYQQSDMFAAPPEKTTKIPTKLIKDRVPEIQQAKIDLSAGLISRDEYDRIVQEYKPVRVFDSVPNPATDEEMRNALKSNQKDRIGVPSATLQEGHPVGIRLDIDAARKNPPVQVVSVHEQLKSYEAGKSIGYENAAVLTNATFGGAEKKAAAIAEGGGKDTIAVVKGNWKPISSEDAKRYADMAMNKPEWSQVGYDPTRHSYFYDRKTLQPIVSGDSVIMIGNLVMVKNPKYVPKSQFLFSVKDRATETAGKVKGAIHKAGQKRRMDEGLLADLPERLQAKARKTFAPENETIVTKVNGLQDKFWQKMAQGIVDQYRTIKDYTKEGYMLARLSKTIDGALEGMLFHGQVFLNSGALDIKSGTKGLLQIMAPLGKDVDRYQMWVALNREAELVARGKIPSIDPELVDARADFAKGTINGRPKLEVYKEVQSEMNKLNRSVLNIALEQGLIDKKAYETFAADINYIPFYKMMEDGDLQGAATASGLGSQYFSKMLEGGEKPFGDLMENTLRNWSHILSASMKNKAAAVTLNAASEVEGARPNLKVGLEWKDGKVYSIKTGEKVGDGSLKPEYTTSEGKGIIKVMIDGKPTYYKVLDDLLLDSVASIGYMGPKSKFLDMSRDFKNILQYGVTLSPGFKVRNLFRDSIQAMAVSGLKLTPWANIVEGWAKSDRNNPAHISALAGGGIFNFGSAYEGDQSRMVKKLIKMGIAEDSILDTDSKIKAGLQKAWAAYTDLGNKSESANRMALYQQMRDKGMSHLEASFHARDLMDFSMQGSFPALRMVTQVVPFLNARLQGLYKLGRDGIIPTSRVFYNSATGKPNDADDKMKAQQFTIVTGAVMMASMMLYLAFKDDEEFKKREEWDRDNFWWFRLPGMDSAVRIPKPFEIGAFGTMSERLLEQMIDQGAEGKQFEDSIKRMLSDTFAMNPTPQIIKPMIDLYANKDSFTGAPIETAGMERLSKAERAADNTSPLAIALSGIQRFVAPTSMELSPVQVDYAIKSYFGWLGGTVAASSHYAVMPFSKGAYPDHNWTETMSMGFIKSLPATQSKYVTAFYENNKQISQAYADMRHYAEIGNQEKVMEILAEKGDLIGLQKAYDHGAKDMAKIRQAISAIRNDPTMSGEQKKEEIDRLKVLIGTVAEQLETVRKSVKK